MGRTACTEPQCLYKGALHLLPYLSIELPPEARNSEEASTFLENLCTPVAVYWPTQVLGFWHLKQNTTYEEGHRGSTVVKVLCYKSEGRWLDPSWCQ